MPLPDVVLGLKVVIPRPGLAKRCPLPLESSPVQTTPARPLSPGRRRPYPRRRRHPFGYQDHPSGTELVTPGTVSLPLGRLPSPRVRRPHPRGRQRYLGYDERLPGHDEPGGGGIGPPPPGDLLRGAALASAAPRHDSVVKDQRADTCSAEMIVRFRLTERQWRHLQ